MRKKFDVKFRKEILCSSEDPAELVSVSAGKSVLSTTGDPEINSG
jgi:hypothetical protein